MNGNEIRCKQIPTHVTKQGLWQNIFGFNTQFGEKHFLAS